jgi:alpha-beta hydrolase superfamily lysophospholipase
VVPGQLAMVFPQPVPVLADLAAALRDAGYAVLTYDKRTCGPFNGCADNGYPEPGEDLTIEAFVDDATAAVGFLRSRPEVRARSVAVAGHSQGASFVPGMLLDDPTLAAGVLLSAPYDPIDALLADQAETLARIVAQLDAPPPGAAGSVTQLRRLATSVSALRSGGAGDSTQLGGAPVGFWRSWLRLSDGVGQLAAQAPQPQLVLTGGADTNVAPSQTAKWRGKLSGDQDRVVELRCVSHALNCLQTDDPMTVDPDAIDATVDPRVARTVAAFLDDVVR